MPKLVLVLVVAVAIQVLGQPISSDDKKVHCYEKECPSTTTVCKKIVQTSDDKKTLNTKIYCLHARVLEFYNENKDNPYGPLMSLQTTSFSGAHVSHPGPHIPDHGGNL